MNGTRPEELTQLLAGWSDGNQEALEQILPLVYADMRKLAASYLRRERQNHTLQSGALVNEAYLKLNDQQRIKWRNRSQFFGVVAQMMRRILVDHARGRAAQKRGAEATMLSISHAVAGQDPRQLDVIALDDALKKLAQLDLQQSKVVELRFFGDLSVDETAEALGISPATVKRDWVVAKGWLFRQLSSGEAGAN